MPMVSQRDDSGTSQLSMTVMMGGFLSSGRDTFSIDTAHGGRSPNARGYKTAAPTARNYLLFP